MHVTIKLFANFRIDRFIEDSPDIPQDTRIRGIVNELGIAENEIGVIMINGRHTSLDHILTEGDTLSVFPLIGGG